MGLHTFSIAVLRARLFTSSSAPGISGGNKASGIVLALLLGLQFV